MDTSISLAFFMGMAAVFNPCGIALLPASLAWVSGTIVTVPHPVIRLGQGLLAGFLMSLGFTAVVAMLGLVVHGLGVVLTPVLYPVMVGLGVALVVSGALVALGLFHFPLDRWIRLDRVPRRRRSEWTFVVAGAVYGVAALSCTLPLFVAAFVPALTVGNGTFIRLLAGFGTGTAVIFVGVSELTLFARDATLRAIRGIGSWLNPLLGLVVAGSGGYLVFYWVWGAGRFLA
ncbi:MAG: cytochrome c biogenesis CcdA family protein [Sulfobacillus sp.]